MSNAETRKGRYEWRIEKYGTTCAIFEGDRRVAYFYGATDDWTHEEARANAERAVGNASPERERLAKWMIQHGFATGHGDTFEDLLDAMTWQVAEKRNPDERKRR
jgi:hypothetical protein